MEAVEAREHANHSHRGKRHTSDGDARNDVYGVVSLFRKEITTGDKEGEIHNAWGAGLLLEQFIDVFDIIKRIVDEEFQFGDDAQLMAHALTQFEAHRLYVGVDVGHDFIAFF